MARKKTVESKENDGLPLFRSRTQEALERLKKENEAYDIFVQQNEAKIKELEDFVKARPDLPKDWTLEDLYAGLDFKIQNMGFLLLILTEIVKRTRVK